MKIGIVVLLLMLMNFGFPYLGAFNAELYIIIYVRLVLLVIIVMYIIVGYVFIKSLNGIGSEMYYLPIIPLYIVLI